MAKNLAFQSVRLKAGITGAVRAAAVLYLAGVLNTAYAADGSSGEPADSAAVLAERLKQGGLVIYLRHAATDRNIPDRPQIDLQDCSTQRPLSQEGRAFAELLGQALASQMIPIGSVFSSPYCRCSDTAKLAFGSAQVQPFLQFSVNFTQKELQTNTRRLRRLISRPVPTGSNRVIVSHTGNLKEALQVWPEEEGGMYVFEADAFGRSPRYLGSIPPDYWRNVVRQLQQAAEFDGQAVSKH